MYNIGKCMLTRIAFYILLYYLRIFFLGKLKNVDIASLLKQGASIKEEIKSKTSSIVTSSTMSSNNPLRKRSI